MEEKEESVVLYSLHSKSVHTRIVSSSSVMTILLDVTADGIASLCIEGEILVNLLP